MHEHMKRTLALILAVMLVVALFAGCGGNTTSTGSTTPATTDSTGSNANTETGSSNTDANTNTETESNTETQADDNSPYHFAAGKFATDDRGIATEKYDYQLPLTEEEETLTFWTVSWNPEYIPEDGFDSMEFPQELKAQTGVNVEYTIVTMDAMQSNYAVLLAADDLRDLMCHGVSYYSGTVKEAVEDGYFINIYDYREYCPNYMYEAAYRDTSDKATYSDVFYEDDFVYSFWDLYDGPVVNMGPVVRNDWVEKVGMTRDGIRTWDDIYDMMVAEKAEGLSTAPWQLINTVEISGAKFFSSFDTIGFTNTSALQTPFQTNGEVQMVHITDNDRNLMEYLNKCWNAGLIDPDWAGAASNNDYLNKVDNCGFFATTASGIMTLEGNCNDPDAEFVTVRKLLREPGQVLHVGEAASRKSYGETCISASCENIPLAVTWCDFRYSDGAYNLINYGKQGYTWDYNDQGKVQLTDQVLNNPEGLATTWCLLLYALNNLADCGLEDSNRKLYYPGGEKYIEFNDIWYDFQYDGAWEWPFGLNLSDEDQQTVNEYAGDYITFISENFTAFIDGSKPMGEWDAYVEGAKSIGGDAIAAIYQATLDAYNA